jgi:hypothetical protein
MTIVRTAARWLGATTLLAALGFVSWAAYLWVLTPCGGDAECMGSFAAFLLYALGLLIVGALLLLASRGS